jgi:hypothetical protein
MGNVFSATEMLAALERTESLTEHWEILAASAAPFWPRMAELI